MHGDLIRCSDEGSARGIALCVSPPSLDTPSFSAAITPNSQSPMSTTSTQSAPPKRVQSWGPVWCRPRGTPGVWKPSMHFTSIPRWSFLYYSCQMIESASHINTSTPFRTRFVDFCILLPIISFNLHLTSIPRPRFRLALLVILILFPSFHSICISHQYLGPVSDSLCGLLSFYSESECYLSLVLFIILYSPTTTSLREQCMLL